MVDIHSLIISMPYAALVAAIRVWRVTSINNALHTQALHIALVELSERE